MIRLKNKKLGIYFASILAFILFSVFFLWLSGKNTGLGVSDNHMLKLKDAKEGQNYQVFQIFTGDAAKDGGALSNLKYGRNYGDEGTLVPDEVAKKTGEGKIEFTELVGKPVAVLTADKPSVELEEGMYVVREGEEEIVEIQVGKGTVYQSIHNWLV